MVPRHRVFGTYSPVKYVSRKSGSDATFSKFKAQNTCNVEFPICLEGLAYSYGQFSSYEPEVCAPSEHSAHFDADPPQPFPGLIYRNIRSNRSSCPSSSCPEKSSCWRKGRHKLPIFAFVFHLSFETLSTYHHFLFRFERGLTRLSAQSIRVPQALSIL